jgi:thiol-disulfide isomerase/thioredoxin
MKPLKYSSVFSEWQEQSSEPVSIYLKISLFLLLLLFSGKSVIASDIVLQNIDGSNDTLGRYLGKGQWVVFNVWGPRCPPCLEEVPELVSFHEDHKEGDAMVVSMALDYPSFGYAKPVEVKAFIEDYFVTFPVLLGDSEIAGKVTGRYLSGTPSTYIYNPEGELVALQVGMVTQSLIEEFIKNYKNK